MAIGAPLASWLVQNGHGLLFGLDGWRFMILVAGVPAVFLGLICFFLLPDRPSDAKWLTAEEAALLEEDVASEDVAESHSGVRGVLGNGKVWLLGLGYFGLVYGLYAISFFLPTIIKGFEARCNVEYSMLHIGLLTAIPYRCAVFFTLFWAWHSRRTNEVPLHVAGSAGLGLVGILIAMVNSPFIVLVGVAIAAMGLCSGLPMSFGMSTKFLAGAAAAAGLALINTIGNLGGFAGPYLFGWVRDLTGNINASLYLIAGFCLLSLVLALVVSRWKSIETDDSSAQTMQAPH